ncbi:MAG: ABC transporter ATP-binding protein/permease [Planctomycetes bacterium]|nr:ABC transporter ATP-binding protein/permease [Planctomycetota bacterium]
MQNFKRSIKLCLRYRWTVVGGVLSALAVAILWGANIGTVYPFVEVVFKGQSLRDWVDVEITKTQQLITDQHAEVAKLNNQQKTAPSEARSALARQVELIEIRCLADQKALEGLQRMRPWIHTYLPATPFATLVWVVAVLMVGTVVKSGFLIISTIFQERLRQHGTLDLRKQFFRRTLRMDMGTFNERGTHELMSRFTYDMDQLGNGLGILFGKALREPLKMAACLIGAGFICWRLLLLSLVVAPLAGFLINRLAGSIKRANRRAMEEMSQIYQVLSEAFGGIKVVKAFTGERYERWRFSNKNREFFRKAMKIARYDSLIRPLTEVMGMITISVAILAGAYLVLNQQTHLLGLKMCDRPLSISALLLFYGLLAGVSDPARRMSDVFGHLQRAAAAADRIYQMMDREPTIQNPVRAVKLGRHRKALTLSGIRFAYPEGDEVLRGIDLEIPFGQALAIVGSNGCGKSTLANLIPRFYDPTHGKVLIDGVDVRDMRLGELRGQIGIVTQETVLFNDTVINNIRYGTRRATREQVIEAAKRAHADRFIESQLDDGYETNCGPQGSRLSGGQRQRISLARAVLRDPSILIMDEATSQVDPESEQVIHRVLSEFIRNRTTILITHRRSTLELADRILVMDAGQIVDIGTHEELIRSSAHYARLFQQHAAA